MLKNSYLIALMAFFAMSCNNQTPQQHTNKLQDSSQVGVDTHTLSNARVIKMKHLDLDIKVDMANRQISGCAIWTIDNTAKAKELVLDTWDLHIDSVLAGSNMVKFSIDSPVKFLGSALHIQLPVDVNRLSIWYHTGKDAKALQWLEPAQTNDKKHPFLYTQSESIYARSWIPCADGPGIRFTYAARVTVPKQLLALMSAENPQIINDSGIYHFKMDLPVPAYLMALAVGDLRFKAIDNRTGVYAEPGMIEKARYEFEDAGKMVSVAEQLYGPYRWGRYDILVAPPGFPIGGMENPRLTFATPTVIAGDRSLVSLIAHELAHSWSGNLVTNATWNDFWMNEGFTDYFEHRIMEQMMGKDYDAMLWEIDHEELVASTHELGDTSRDTWLQQNLDGRDPEDGFTDIPYEKGSHFLKLIELSAGRAKFDSFLNTYFNSHAFKTITTEDFLHYLNANLIKNDTVLSRKINLNAWVYGPGIPNDCPRAYPIRFMKVDTERAKFLHGIAPGELVTKGWSTHEWLHFLRGFDSLNVAQMKSLDDKFHLSTTGNCEIADLWYVMSLKNSYSAAYPAMEKFLSSVGRQKFLGPLYTEMMKTKNGEQMAKQLFEKYKNNYHPLAQKSISKIVYKI